MLKPNLGDIVSNDPPVGGPFRGKISRVKDTVSSNNNPMLIVNVEFEDGGIRYEAAGFHVYRGRGAQGFENLLRATHFGDVADRLMKGEDLEFDEQQLVDQEVQIYVDEYVKGDGKAKSIQKYVAV